MRIILTALLLFAISVSQGLGTPPSKEQLSIGSSVALNSISTDPKYVAREESAAIPSFGGDFEYSSIELPVFGYGTRESGIRWKAGSNSSALLYQEKLITPTSQATINNVTSFELSILHFYLVRHWSQKFFNLLTGFVGLGPSIAEIVLITTIEEVQQKKIDGKLVDWTQHTDKKYAVDYRPGFVSGAGLYIDFGTSSVFGFQANLYYVQTTLRHHFDSNINASSIQLGAFYQVYLNE